MSEVAMTITLELPHGNRSKLLAQAKARGLPLDALRKIVIVSQAGSADTAGKCFRLCKERSWIEPSMSSSTLFKFRQELDRERCIVKTGIDDRRRYQRLSRFNSNV